MILLSALFLKIFASLIYLLTICVVLWPVIAIILLSSAPDSAATVAKPDLKLWPAKFLLSIPAKFKYYFISKTTDWSVNLWFVNEKPLVNLLKIGPDLILEISNHFLRLIIGQ